MNNIDFNQLRDRAYQCACDHGFHQLELSNEHFLMLVITELSEAVEADRKSRYFDREKYRIGEYSECQGWVTNEEKFINVFNKYVKGTVEEELSDVVIRLLDLAGLRDIYIGPFDVKIDTKKSIPEHCYKIASIITKYPLEDVINVSLGYLIALANHLDIDLVWHIEQKQKYNELKSYKHGKEY